MKSDLIAKLLNHLILYYFAFNYLFQGNYEPCVMVSTQKDLSEFTFS